MKCALEVALINEEAKAEKERLEKLKAEQEAREKAEWAAQRKRQVIENTIEFCETKINDTLIANAKKGMDKVVITIPIRFSYGDHEEFVTMKEVPGNNFSYYDRTSAWLDTKTLIDYLSSNCYTVKFESANFRCCNGGTFWYGANLIVSIEELDCID
jgi:hypothetical protein